VTIGTITVKYVGELVPEGFDVSVFDAPETASGGTGMLYPSDGAAIPKNQPSMHFQWEDLGASAYRLRFESEVTELTIYSTDLSWISDTELWPVIGESNAGSTVLSTLSGRVGDQVLVKDPQSMVVQDLEAVGSIIYWTPTAQGLMEIPYGSPAESFLTVTETGKCVGCHAVSSAGMVAFTYDGGSAPLGMKTIDERADVIAYDTAGDSNFKVFSPDGSMLLSGLNGTLSLFDGITGSFISNPTIDGASWITHMDWAPDDSYMVFATSSSMSGDYNFTNGSIMRAEHLGGGVFGPAEAIVSAVDLDPSFGFTNVYYPAVSPDSQWVLFNASTGDSYDDLDATLFVVPIEGGTPIELTQANINASMANSLPKWAPATAGDDVWWFAFASRRTYGSLTAGNPQIWLSSFDPAEAEAGADPSSAAIWLSNQDSSQNNHIPLWVK
jgi:Tol biopolymer transport system component